MRRMPCPARGGSELAAVLRTRPPRRGEEEQVRRAHHAVPAEVGRAGAAVRPTRSPGAGEDEEVRRADNAVAVEIGGARNPEDDAHAAAGVLHLHLVGEPLGHDEVEAPGDARRGEDLEGATVNFGCSGIDLEKFITYILKNPSSITDWGDASGEKEATEFSTYLREPFDKAKEAGEIPKDVRMESYWGSFTDAGEIPNMNAIHMAGIDATDVWDLTRGEIEGRQRVMWAVEALKKYAPGFEKARLRTIGASIGCRESRKIVGDYDLSEHDVLNQAEFEDTIGIFPEFLDGNGIAILPSTGRYFQVPFRITVPKNVENLLVAGRCVAGDKVSHAATRQMMCCTVTGQGAGVASAISLETGVASREVDISRVQEALRKQGVRLT